MTLSTAKIRFPRSSLTLGADGFVPRNPSSGNRECCPDPLCTPFCDMACAFVDILPTGPMWDFQKAAAKASIVECNAVPEASCPTMANYAVYGAQVAQEAIQTILWPALRESDPTTAVTTLDDWLLRYGWQDCYRSYCRSEYMGTLSPYDRRGECGMSYCPTSFDYEFECALKVAILKSLSRLRRGVIKNLAGINWVIQPLGAVLRPRKPYPLEVRRFLNGQCAEDGLEPCFCDVIEYEICNTTETLPGCPVEACDDLPSDVSAVQGYECGDQPLVDLYPGVIAAECIVRSMLQKKCPNIIYRCATATGGLIPPDIG